MVGLRAAGADPLVEPREPGGVLAGLVEDVGPRVDRVARGRLDGEGVGGEVLRLAPPLLVLADERELAGVPPVVAVGAAERLHELGGLGAGGEAAERDRGHRDADRECVAGEEAYVPQQGGGTGGLVGAQSRGDGVEEAALAVVEVPLVGGAVRRAQRGTPVGGGAPLVAEEGEGRVRLDEVGVGGDCLGEARLDAVLEAEQPAEGGVVALRGLAVGRQREAVGVGRAAARLAVQRPTHHARHVVGLLPDLRHRGRLPQVAAAQRADREQRPGLGQGAEHAAVVGGVDAEPGRAGADEPGAGQPGQQGVGGDRADRTGAVDDGADAQDGSVVEGHLEGVGSGAYVGDGAAVAHQPPGVGDRPEAGVGHRRHPVAVDVPGAGVLADEAALVGLRQAAPELRGHRAEAVDGGPPVADRLGGRGDVGAQRATELVQPVPPGDAGRRRGRGSGGHDVVLGHRVVAGDGVEGATLAVGADREVDHGQAGAEQQHVTGVGDRLRPRVAHQPRVVEERLGCPARARGAAGGEHDGAGLDPLAVGELDDETVAVR